MQELNLIIGLKFIILNLKMIKFTIPGKPKALKRHRVSKFGGMYDPSSKDKKDIMIQMAQFKPKVPLDGNIALTLRFTLPRPKNHYRTGKYKHLLKDSSPELHSVKPDLSNLVKLYEDILQPDFYVDDSQICVLYAFKEYGKEPETHVQIEEI